ncbi:hypothetical protein [Micromonospora echinaurantiaca]|uniref:hypothetical protein n=1 Tax=Micromonospora echinaurantiaca TaxID=47857 RepID=UPI0037B6AFBB
MTDLDQRIASVLREHAEGEIDSHRLLSASRARGRRRQLRRRAATGTALALVGVLGFVGVTGPDLTGLPGRLPWTAATPPVAAPVPPRADGVPGAAADPARIGMDPQVLHFGVDTGRARYLGWEVNAVVGVETVRLDVAGGPVVTVEVARSAEVLKGTPVEFRPTPPGGRPGSFDGTVQRVALEGTTERFGLVVWWSPGAGRYARASSSQGQDPAALTQAMAALRWDEARRCASPLRLGALPAGAEIGWCSVDVASYPGLITAQFTIRRGADQSMWVSYRYASQVAATRTEGNRTVGGRPAYLSPKGTTLELLGLPRTRVVADFGWPPEGNTRPGAFTEQDAGVLLAGARLAEDPTRPQTWP